jgi:hypothetical protein
MPVTFMNIITDILKKNISQLEFSAQKLKISDEGLFPFSKITGTMGYQMNTDMSFPEKAAKEVDLVVSC